MNETWKEKCEKQKKELREIARKLKMRVDRLNSELEIDAPDMMIKNELRLIGEALKECEDIQSIISGTKEKKENTAEDSVKALAGAMLLHTLLQITDL